MKRQAVAKKMSKVGYKRKGYVWSKSIKHKKQTGHFGTISGGSGHRAGERWGDTKGIDPESRQRRYSKNSPSFDEGVWQSKKKRMAAKMGKRINDPSSYENF